MASQPREKTAETLGANVRYLREHASISQTELARRMAERGWPWHQSTVYRVESGRQPVRFDEAVDLADLLGTTLDRLTWAIGEAAEQELAETALNRLRDSTVDAVEAVTQFHSARAGARRAARDAAGSEYVHVREAAAPITEELLHATLEGVLAAAQAQWKEQGGEVDPADAPWSGGKNSGAPQERDGFPFEAVHAAAALYGQAVMTAVTPKFLARITKGMTAGVMDEVIAAVAEVAREEGNGTVLRHIRQTGLERLAAEGIAAELIRHSADGMPSGGFDQFWSVVFAAWQGGQSGWESARKEALDYVERGGTSMLDMANLLVAKMPTDALPAFIPLRERSVAGLVPSRDKRVRETQPQAVIPAADKDGA